MSFKTHAKRSPNLLEQEVRSVTQILNISVALMKLGNSKEAVNGHKAAFYDLAEPWFAKYAAIVCVRFMDLDDTLASNNPIPSDLIAAYKPAVLLSLEGLRESDVYSSASPRTRENRFLSHLQWVGPLVSRLILCHDREVRFQLSQLFESSVLPLILDQKP